MTVLLLTPDSSFERRVRTALGAGTSVETADPVILQEGPGYAVSAVVEHHPQVEVVIVGPDLDEQYALEYAYEFDLQRPDVSVILCVPTSADVLGEAMRAGVRDVVDPLAGDERILEAFKRATEAAARARSRAPTNDHGGDRAASVIAVVSPKGGSGKTTIATNLAVGLATAAPGQVSIVDLDLQFGDVATALQLMPEYSVADAARSVASLDAMSLKVLLTHHPLDLYALCAPDSPAEGERISASQTAQVLDLMRRDFRHVVVDTTAGLGEHTLAALEAATDIVLICSMDVPGVRSFRTTLITLDEVGLTNAQRHTVLTRADSRVGLNVEDIERTIGRPIDVMIPSTRAVPLSVNQGTPILQTDQRRSSVHQALTTLAGRFVDLPADQASGVQPRRWRRRR
jgi:Flp pilus assembly CpaE family ATPase